MHAIHMSARVAPIHSALSLSHVKIFVIIIIVINIIIINNINITVIRVTVLS